MLTTQQEIVERKRKCVKLSGNTTATANTNTKSDECRRGCEQKVYGVWLGPALDNVVPTNISGNYIFKKKEGGFIRIVSKFI